MRFPPILLLAAGASSANTANYTSLVNLFIGTAKAANGASGGNMFPGAAVPHAMAKVGIDCDTVPRQAGYIADNSSVTGISLMHDEGTGGEQTGGYGIFPLFPLSGCSTVSCPVALNTRKALRAAGADAATPGYFTTTFVNGIKLEATSTRRAGLIRFTYPSDQNNHVVVDLSNDLQRSFRGGSLRLDSATRRVMLQGTYRQSYGTDNYTAFGCYDFDTTPQMTAAGTFQSKSASTPSDMAIALNGTTLDFPYQQDRIAIESGAVLSFTNTQSVLARFGVSFISSKQACANAEQEIPSPWNWDQVQEFSRSAWEETLSRVKIDPEKEEKTIVELLYSSLYRVSLVPANMTGENPYWDNTHPFYDALFCSWDTFRTVHPMLSIFSPKEWAEIVSTYVDGWRHTGFIPECRANTKAGYVQGGGNGMPILGDFVVKYRKHAAQLGVNTDNLYQALVDTAENTPPDWYRVGRQNTAWKEFGYLPTNWVDPFGSTGLPTREASRAAEYALGDFAVRQAGKVLGKSKFEVTKYQNRSMNFVNHWDANLEFDGFKGFSQRRLANGTFIFSRPDACSPVDPIEHSCSRGTDNDVGFYQSSPWEGSFYAPQSMSTIVKLMGGPDTFIKRLDFYFSKGYFQAGNEPSFTVPSAYHYANRPDLTALRIREVVYKNFNTGLRGIPGNDDSGAMGALLAFHLLGLYPVLDTNQILISSPFVSQFSLRNPLFGTTTTFTVDGFDSATLQQTPPAGSQLFVQSISVGGVMKKSRCWLTFEEITGGKDIVIKVGNDVPADGCGTGAEALPGSLELGQFNAVAEQAERTDISAPYMTLEVVIYKASTTHVHNTL